MNGPKLFLVFCSLISAAQASENIPFEYVPKKVRLAIQDYIPGATIEKTEIDSDDTWGTTFESHYLRGRHEGNIKVAANGELLNVEQELDPDEIPSKVRRSVIREARGGLIRKAELKQYAGHLAYKVEAYYGTSDSKVSVTATRSGTVLNIDFD